MKEEDLSENWRGGREEDEDFISENGSIISYLVVELVSKIRFIGTLSTR